MPDYVPLGRLLLLSLTACSGGAATEDSSAAPGAFPDDFLWGAAVAGFQVDPGCPTIAPEDCEDRASDWYQWVTDEELVADGSTHNSGDPLSLGPGHYELYEADFDLAQDLGLGAMRVSLEWSRLFPTAPPEGTDTVEELAQHADPEAVAWTHAYLQALHDRGLEPLVTLNHYTLPLWIHDGKACHADPYTCSPAGWLDGEAFVEQLALFSGFCAMEFGEQITWWATLNEPLAVVLAGYLLPTADRTNPPGVAEADLGFAVMISQIEAHAAMYDAVHAYDEEAKVGAVPNLVVAVPDDPDDPEDIEGAEHLDYVYNRVFLNGTVLGQLDLDLDGVVDETRPELAGRMDYIGVNYYSQIRVGGLSFPLFPGYELTDFVPLSVWDELPEGLGEVATLAHGYGLPVIITENGTPELDGAGERFLRPGLASLEEAAAVGVDVGGYFYWSLIDNYEWNHGMGMPFGLYEVDLSTKARTRRPVADTYADIVRANSAR